jgi:two-component sensor histidine kinase
LEVAAQCVYFPAKHAVIFEACHNSIAHRQKKYLQHILAMTSLTGKKTYSKPKDYSFLTSKVIVAQAPMETYL